jgi:hypothetical protein
MRRALVGAAALLLTACGGGDGSGGTDNSVDNAPAFVATWSGTLTGTDPASGDVIGTTTVSLPITESAENKLMLGGFCVDDSGPTVTVTSATQFALEAPFACPPDTTEAGCASIVLTFTSLPGMLSAGTLSLSGSVTGVGCNVTATENFSFTSASATKK